MAQKFGQMQSNSSSLFNDGSRKKDRFDKNSADLTSDDNLKGSYSSRRSSIDMLLNSLHTDVLGCKDPGSKSFRVECIEEEIMEQIDDDDDVEDAFELPHSPPHRMHFLENMVYLSPKRNGRAASLPATAPLVNLNELVRLQEMYERAKGKEAAGGGTFRNIGKSVFNRISKKLSSTNIDGDGDDSDDVFEPDSPDSIEKKPVKTFERKSSSLPSAFEVRSRSSRMGQRLKRTFTTAKDNLLQQAIVNSDVEMLEKLLVHDRCLKKINFLEPPGVSVFHQACVFGKVEVVQLLLDKGADIALPTWKGLSPLKIAAMSGHFDTAKLLLDSGADSEDIRNGFQTYIS